MPGLWFVDYNVVTPSGRVFKKSARVGDPGKHFGEYLKRFYPTAVKIDWTPMDEAHKNAVGPTRTVEFDTAGKVTKRTPDHDGAHIGRADFEAPEDLDWNAGGHSRAGVVPGDDDDVGRHPNGSNDDEDPNLLADQVTRALGYTPQPPPLNGVIPAAAPVAPVVVAAPASEPSAT